MLRNLFHQLTFRYTDNEKLANQLWDEIENAYTSPQRYYHTLHHLQSVLHFLNPVKREVTDWDVVLFSVFYHDFVYDILSAENELQSAEIAAHRLALLNFPLQRIECCRLQILATKTHALNSDMDTNLVLDADMAILGQEKETYMRYAAGVRNEYAMYPDAVYLAGRKQVLRTFLQQNTLFHTSYFYRLYENAARENLLSELNSC